MQKVVVSALLILSTAAVLADQDCCPTSNCTQQQEQTVSADYKLFESIYSGDITQITYYLNDQNADVNCIINNITPLAFALLQTVSYTNFYDIIKTLLEAGASTDFTLNTENGSYTINTLMQEILNHVDNQFAECTKRSGTEALSQEEEQYITSYREALQSIAHNVQNVIELISLYHQ